MPKRRILLVDDDDDDRYLIRDAFKSQSLDVEIDEAWNGDHALHMLASMQPLPALIVVDMNMPGMDGIETIQHLRRLQPSIPVVLLTTSLTGELASDAIELGANGCFNKPMQFEDTCSLATQLYRRFLQD